MVFEKELNKVPKSKAETNHSKPADSQFETQELQRRQEIDAENTDRRVSQVLTMLEQPNFAERELASAVREVREKEKKTIGTIGMLKELWGVIPPDAKTALIGEFIFNPQALKARYYNEMHFRKNVLGRWNVPKNNK